jgi:hypothetical protein
MARPGVEGEGDASAVYQGIDEALPVASEESEMAPEARRRLPRQREDDPMRLGARGRPIGVDADTVSGAHPVSGERAVEDQRRPEDPGGKPLPPPQSGAAEEAAEHGRRLVLEQVALVRAVEPAIVELPGGELDQPVQQGVGGPRLEQGGGVGVSKGRLGVKKGNGATRRPGCGLGRPARVAAAGQAACEQVRCADS